MRPARRAHCFGKFNSTIAYLCCAALFDRARVLLFREKKRLPFLVFVFGRLGRARQTGRLEVTVAKGEKTHELFVRDLAPIKASASLFVDCGFSRLL